MWQLMVATAPCKKKAKRYWLIGSAHLERCLFQCRPARVSIGDSPSTSMRLWVEREVTVRLRVARQSALNCDVRRRTDWSHPPRGWFRYCSRQ